MPCFWSLFSSSMACSSRVSLGDFLLPYHRVNSIMQVRRVLKLVSLIIPIRGLIPKILLDLKFWAPSVLIWMVMVFSSITPTSCSLLISARVNIAASVRIIRRACWFLLFIMISFYVIRNLFCNRKLKDVAVTWAIICVLVVHKVVFLQGLFCRPTQGGNYNPLTYRRRSL